MRTANPVLNENTFRHVNNTSHSQQMTINGTVNKTIILIGLLLVSATYFWINMSDYISSGMLNIYMIGSIILGLIVALITIFKKEWSPVTAPIYALVEGVFLGLISAFFERMFPGIVLQAVALTCGTLFCLLFAYKSRLIKVTENFKLGVIAATGAIVVIYFISMLLNVFGITVPYIHESGLIGIGFSLFVVVIASLNLVLDFDFIENAVKNKVPKYMEWYGAFGLIITLVWLYVEILKLLAKLRSRD